MTNVIEAKNEADLKDIQAGDQWVFTGWPEPPVTEREQRSFEKDMERAQARFDKLAEFVERKLCEQESDE